jgi:hypothetical protein
MSQLGLHYNQHAFCGQTFRSKHLLNFALAISLIYTHAAYANNFEHRPEQEPTSIDMHLAQAQHYLELGDYASAKFEFETVLRLENLPSNLQQQVESYAEAAEDYAEGKRLLASAYTLIGFGNYRENATTGSGADDNDNFFSARIGGNLNYLLSNDYALNNSLDYRFRSYDRASRRNDADLRWNTHVSHTYDAHTLSLGVRGRTSYRGDGNYRNDYGLFGNWVLLVNANQQFNFGAEFRRRNYPRGALRERTRNIAELTSEWKIALLDGKASFSVLANIGREFAVQNRPDGDSNFYGLTSTLNITINKQWSSFVTASWQNDRYNIERLNIDEDDEVLDATKRNDDLYEVGAGLTWTFAPSWSLNPELLYVHDKSNVLALNFSSTELWMTVRKDF